MAQMDHKESADFIRNDLRLKTFPVAVKFLKETAAFPEKTRQPSVILGKRITICQGVTMARTYGWTVGLTQEDLVCVPGMIAFGFSDAPDPAETLGKLFCEVEFSQSEEMGRNEADSMIRLENREYEAIVLAPLQKGLYDPDTVVFHGNPAQMMRLIQGLVYEENRRILGNFGGKVECSEYLIAPYKTQSPRIVIPGMGDRIFSMTQDDEMVCAIPGHLLEKLVQGLKKAGKKIGARYPVTFYQNFQPEFPKPYKVLGEALGIL
ncbi:MAG: DUF169 domain-containing protein [Deltaproteobacteria bacterium]|nr:DUF169 domain-containing protein [Deltaproteobacteria bacterium]